jgi:molecular chaperone GrpE
MMKDKERAIQEEGHNELRVTDRRRVYLDQDGNDRSNDGAELSSLKPSYVEELELRTRAAEHQVQEVRARFDQLREQLQRETDETRIRLNRAADERAATDTARFIASLLPVMDDLNRAIQSATDGANRDALLQGLRGIATSFQNALVNVGVEPIESIGEMFNPELHQAVDTGAVGTEMDGKVIEEYSRGFTMGDRLLRPAQVKVGRVQQSKRAPE